MSIYKWDIQQINEQLQQNHVGDNKWIVRVIYKWGNCISKWDCFIYKWLIGGCIYKGLVLLSYEVCCL